MMNITIRTPEGVSQKIYSLPRPAVVSLWRGPAKGGI